MAIRFECPKCGKHLSATDDYAGKEGKCKCGEAVIVPGGTDRIRFRCKKCGKGISVRKAHAGKQGQCPTCKGVVTVPVLGKALGPSVQLAVGGAGESKPRVPARSSGAISFTCPMCNANVTARENAAGNIMECPSCGCFVEAPGPEQSPAVGGIELDWEGGAPVETAAPTAAGPVSTGKTVCPSCLRKLADDAPVCTRCGIYVATGRPILTAWDVDQDELEDRARGVVSGVSWLIPFGIYPVYSEAMGNHRPYAIWGITAVTILVSLWFLALEISSSPKMQSAKNLMLWGGGGQPDPRRIELLYEYTTYGDAAAFEAKKQELSATTPEDQLTVTAMEALEPQQRCFGQYRHVQLITHAFLHGGLLHLAGNMVFLLVFGTRVNAAIGNILTLILYPILAVAAALTHLATMGAEPPTPMLGASGAIMGLAGMYLLLYPVHKIYSVIWLRWGLIAAFHLSFKCFAVRGFWVVLFYIMFDIVAVSLGQNDGTAHWAHIGGLVWGMAIAFALLMSRLAYSRSDMLSLVLGKLAWRIIGTPASHMK